MSTTPDTPTPETDADYKEAQDFDRSALVEPLEKFMKLERERDSYRAEIESMREAIKEASLQVSAFLGFYSDSLSLPQMRSLSECINKLQPFLTQPKQ